MLNKSDLFLEFHNMVSLSKKIPEALERHLEPSNLEYLEEERERE